MAESHQRGIEEAFVIETEAIDFFGALVQEKEGLPAVNGRVRFRDGTRWYFQSSKGDRASLRRKLSSICETLASLYRADIFCLKFHRVLTYEEFVRVLQQTKQKMAYA